MIPTRPDTYAFFIGKLEGRMVATTTESWHLQVALYTWVCPLKAILSKYSCIRNKTSIQSEFFIFSLFVLHKLFTLHAQNVRCILSVLADIAWCPLHSPFCVDSTGDTIFAVLWIKGYPIWIPDYGTMRPLFFLEKLSDILLLYCYGQWRVGRIEISRLLRLLSGVQFMASDHHKFGGLSFQTRISQGKNCLVLWRNYTTPIGGSVDDNFERKEWSNYTYDRIPSLFSKLEEIIRTTKFLYRCTVQWQLLTENERFSVLSGWGKGRLLGIRLFWMVSMTDVN